MAEMWFFFSPVAIVNQLQWVPESIGCCQGEGKTTAAVPFPPHLPPCRGCVDLLSEVLAWRAAGIWLAGCHAYRNHICISAWPLLGEIEREIQREMAQPGGTMGIPFLCGLNFASSPFCKGYFTPFDWCSWCHTLLWGACSISVCFTENGASDFVVRWREHNCSWSCIFQEVKDVLFLSRWSLLFPSPRKHFL